MIKPRKTRIRQQIDWKFAGIKEQKFFSENWGKLLNSQNNLLNEKTFFSKYHCDYLYPHMWENQWNNLHFLYKSLVMQRILQKFFLSHDLYLNKLYIKISHNKLKIFTNSFGVFRQHKLRKRFGLIKTKLNATKQIFNRLKFFLRLNNLYYLIFNFERTYLPLKFIVPIAKRVFKRYKRQRFFWESLQIVYAAFKGYASSSLLGSLVYTHTRRNPKRLAFVAYIKRLLDWHFRYFKNLKKKRSSVLGVRIEVKGRFNAKSRSKKHILSSGAIKIHEKAFNVDHSFVESYTKFGSIGIKVWICPKKIIYNYVNNTKKNKI